MAVAEIIGAAIGVLLLVVVAYVLVGGTLSSAETVANAQKELTLMQESRLHTDIAISDIDLAEEPGVMKILNFSVTNVGDESITDIPHMDVFTFDTGNGYIPFTYWNNAAVPPESLDPHVLPDYYWTTTWFKNDEIHARQLDSNVTVRIMARFPVDVTPISLQVTTHNGVSTMARIP